jgi:hypothetical protein
MKIALCPATTLLGSATLSFVTRPKRTQISYLAALTTATHAAFRRERRTQLINATKFHRKSGGAERRDLCVDDLSWKCFSTE